MAVKPLISTITPWDATVGVNIAFSYSGNLPVRAKGIIQNASTLETRWTGENPVVRGEDGKYLFYIPANTLKADIKDVNGNGNKYCIQITVFDGNDIASTISDKAYFWCLSTPEFYYTKPNVDEKITTASIELNIIYNQLEGEKLYSFRHYLYDNSKNLISISDYFYDDSGLIYFFKGLENKTSYYVRSQGVTKNGIPVDTGYSHIFTDYGDIENYALLGLTSDDNATVYGDTNMICIDADEDPEYYIYINSYVQLIKKKVTYQTNYTIPRDFTLQIKITKLLYCGLLLKMYNKENPDCIITLDSYYFDDNKIRYCLKVFNGIATYVLYTVDGFSVENDDVMVITIRRINNFFSLYAEKEE